MWFTSFHWCSVTISTMVEPNPRHLSFAWIYVISFLSWYKLLASTLTKASVIMMVFYQGNSFTQFYYHSPHIRGHFRLYWNLKSALTISSSCLKKASCSAGKSIGPFPLCRHPYISATSQCWCDESIGLIYSSTKPFSSFFLLLVNGLIRLMSDDPSHKPEMKQEREVTLWSHLTYG